MVTPDEAREALARLIETNIRLIPSVCPCGGYDVEMKASGLGSLAAQILATGWTPPVDAPPVATDYADVSEVRAAIERQPASVRANLAGRFKVGDPAAVPPVAGDVREAAARLADKMAESWWHMPGGNGYTASDLTELAERIRVLPTPEVTEKMVERAMTILGCYLTDESDEDARKKVRAALTAALQPALNVTKEKP